MTRTLHVSHLGFTVEPSDLRRLFGGFGTVRRAEILASVGARVAVIEMGSSAEADAALAAPDGSVYIGHVLSVRRTDAPRSDGAGARPDALAGPDRPVPGGFGDRGGEGAGGAEFFVAEVPDRSERGAGAAPLIEAAVGAAVPPSVGAAVPPSLAQWGSFERVRGATPGLLTRPAPLALNARPDPD